MRIASAVDQCADRVSNLERINAVAHVFDHAGDVKADDRGGFRRGWIKPSPLLHVGPINPGGEDPYQNLPRLWPRTRLFSDLKNFRPAGLLDQDSLHGFDRGTHVQPVNPSRRAGLSATMVRTSASLKPSARQSLMA